MAESDSTLQEKASQPVDADSRAFCPSCKEAYWWVYGEDCMPTSLSCGHSLCFKCAKSQWSNPDSEDTSVFCVTCSVQVGITTYKCPPSSQAENNNANSCLPMELETVAINSSGVAAQSTPTHLRSFSAVTHHPTSEGQQHACSVAYNSAERVTSALSSPMVLDKIQSQDDAWRLLQHDEGFIRDWIVANVPDHVIFKMVGAGNPDAVIATNVDSNSFVFSSGNTVVISSPPKTADTTLTAAKAACPSSSATLPGVSTFLGESSTSRASFEQQFLHYLVNKTSQDRLAEDSGEQELQVAPGTVDSSTQQDGMVDDVMGLTVVSVTSQMKAAPSDSLVQGMDQTKAAGVGNKGDCRVQPDKESQTLGTSVITRMTADGEASQLASSNRAVITEVESRHILESSVVDMPAETAAYGPDLTAHQCLSGLQQQPTGYSSLPPCGGPPFPPSLAQNPHSQQSFASIVPGNTVRYSNYPRRARFPTGGLAATPGPTTPATYGNYLYPYPPHAYPLHDQYRPQYAVPRRFGPAHFTRFPQHVTAHRGARFGRGRGTNFPRPLRSPHDYPWYSKACSTSISLSPAPRLTSQPQIRVVQVLRPKTETQGQWGDGSTEDRGDAGKESLPGTVNPEAPSAEEQEAAEVAVMKTRAMPHGAQVEDIYVVPQVWLSAGQAPTPPVSPHSKCPACPFPTSRPQLRDPSLNVPAAPAVQPENVCMVDNSFPIKTEPVAADRYTPSTVGVQNFSDPAGSQDVKQPPFENQDLSEDTGSQMEAMPDGNQAVKNNIEDSTDYTDFQPVALVTVSKTKVRADEPEAATATTVTQDTLVGAPSVHTILSGSSTAVSSDGPWEQSEETPVMKMGGFSGTHSSLMHVPPAPTKKQDANILQRKSAAAKFPHCESARNAVTLANYVGTCNKTVQDALDSESARNAVADGQADSYMDGVEVVETKSTVPAAIMLPKPDTATFLPARKKLRRNLAAEFYNSSLGEQGHGQTTEFVSVGRRPRGRRGRRCPSTNYSLYRSSLDGSQPPVYPFASPYSYDPHAYGLFDDKVPLHNSCLRYGPAPPSVTAAFPLNPGKPVDPKLVLPDDSGHAGRHNATHHPLLHRVSAIAGGYPQPGGPVSPTQLFPEVLGHLNSGQGDYNSLPSSNGEQGLHYDYVQDDRALFGINADVVCRSGALARQDGVNSRLHIRPVRRGRGSWVEGHGHAGDWKVGATGHAIRADELDTVHWLLREVTELKKQINNEVLTSLQGCLSLLERNVYQESNAPCLGAPQGREMGDLDHLLCCILSLGQVAVHFGWWCRPHCWDHSSERWGEMALLASQVFGESIHKLNQALTFYLDHVCAVNGNDSLVSGEGKEAVVDNVKLEDPSVPDFEASRPDRSSSQIPYGQLVTVCDDLSQNSMAPTNHPKPYTTTATSQSETNAAAVSREESYAAAANHLESYTTAGDHPESYDSVGERLETYSTGHSQSYATADDQSEPYATTGEQLESYTTAGAESESCATAGSQKESYTSGGQSESFDETASQVDSYATDGDRSESYVTVINHSESYATASDQLESCITALSHSDLATSVDHSVACAVICKQSESCATVANRSDVVVANQPEIYVGTADQPDSSTKDDHSESCDTACCNVQMYTVIFREIPNQCADEDDETKTSDVERDPSYVSADSVQSEEYTMVLHQLAQDSVPCQVSAPHTDGADLVLQHKSDSNDMKPKNGNGAASTHCCQNLNRTVAITDPDSTDETGVDCVTSTTPASELTPFETRWGCCAYRQLYNIDCKGIDLDITEKQPDNEACCIKGASVVNVIPKASYNETSAQELEEGDFDETSKVLKTLQAVKREEEIRENSSMVYTLPQTAEDIQEEFTSVEKSHSPVFIEETHNSAKLPQGPAEVSINESLPDAPAAQVWEDPAEVECLIICQIAEMDRHFPSSTPPTDIVTQTAELDNPDTVINGSENVFQNEKCGVSTFSQSIPADHHDGSVPCSRKGIVSDTVCIKADVETCEQGVNSLDPIETSLSEENSSDFRGNWDADISIVRKRKNSKTVQSRSKCIKLDADSGKEVLKKTSKGEKWNLRSSKSSPIKCRHSPRNSSRKL